MIAEPRPSVQPFRRQIGQLVAAWLVVLAVVAFAASMSLTVALDRWLCQLYQATPPAARMPTWSEILLLPLAGAFLLLLLTRLHGVRLFAALALAVLVGMGMDLLLMRSAGVHWGAGAWLLSVALLAMAAQQHAARRAMLGLERLEQWLTAHARELHAEDCETERETLFRFRFATLCQQYVPCNSALLAEMPPGQRHLRFRAFHAAVESDIDEMRRDTGRMPYAEAFATRRAVWSESYMAPELALRSLLLPLYVDDLPVGLWVVNLPAHTRPADAWLDTVHRLAGHLALCLCRRAAAMQPPPPTLAQRLLTTDRPVPEVVAVSRLVEAVTSGQAALLGLLDDAPIGLLSACLWGEVLYANRAIREELAALGAGDPSGQELVHLLMIMSGLSHVAVMDKLRQLLATGQPWPFRSGQPSVAARGTRPSAAWVLSYWAPPARSGGDRLPHRLVLMLAPAGPTAGLLPPSEGKT